ncbi:MAG: NADH-quinone oxidoreductase subunit C [Chloroflexota bacterium]
MNPAEAAGALSERFGGVIGDVVRFRGEVTAVIDRESIVEVARFCRDDLQYDFLSDLTCTDWLDRTPRFDVVYHLMSTKHWTRFRLKVPADEVEPVPSVIPVWGAANWAEREVHDLFGVTFAGHPNLDRLLMPEGWIGHPLRKDYAQTQITLPRPKSDKTLNRQ